MSIDSQSRIAEAFNTRLSIYRQKRDAAKPLGADCYNRHEVFQLVVEAIELLAREVGISKEVSRISEDGE